ncbi:MAG: polysaccharide deacetylase family protein [Bacteroidales bacterium]|nr:polysaccharide deacetylase family protein [Bacteroidales bacterium]MBQ4197363.1 polysaccharide deacetylase family protein [Bacteroidales bacterium]
MKIDPPKFIKRLFPSFIWKLPNTKGEVYLTFDDGPRPEVTPWVLDQLDKFDAKATFFCLGKNVEMFPELFEEIKRRGHAVGNHSYSHVKGWGMKTGDYVRDIDIADDLIHSNLFRPPYARIGPSQARVLAERYRHIMWTIISRDYSRRTDGQKCVKNVVPYLESGAIIAFHDSIKCAGNLFEALPQVLEAIREKGLHSARIEL